MKNIFFADNDLDFLATRAEFLERAGYHIMKATTLANAERKLQEEWAPLAILDIRMENDDDEKDVSGLTLVKADFTRSITKIVLTNFETHIVRDLLRAGQRGQPLTVDVIGKQEGPDALVRAINEAFALHVHINWNLAIDWKARDPFSLVSLISPGLEGERLLSRAGELEDLYRRLFYEKDQIRLDRFLWHRNGRVALVVFAFKQGAKSESFVVVCGQNAMVNEEARRFGEIAPKAPSDTGTMLSLKAETTHFAANAYSIVGNNLERTQSLYDYYHSAPEKIFNDALTVLFQHTLQEWHQDKPMVERNNSLETLYRQNLELDEENFSKADFGERIKVIVDQIATIGSRIARMDKVLKFQLNNQSFSFPNPLLIFSRPPNQEEDVLAINVPGMLTGENILTGESGHAWLTDFAEAGLAPLYWNFVALEAAIRFDWIETNNMLRRHEIEYCLLNTDFANPDTRGLESIVGRPARAITAIRKLSARSVGKDTQSYHLGIFFHAARRLADFSPVHPLTTMELARLGHILLSMAMIAGKLEQGEANEQPATHTQINQVTIVDEKARILMIANRKEHLAPQPFEVFRYLYLHANEVCTKEELLKIALKGEYDESNLHTLIRRIRKVIEDDPEHPRYLITEPNAGYRLIPKPED